MVMDWIAIIAWENLCLWSGDGGALTWDLEGDISPCAKMAQEYLSSSYRKQDDKNSKYSL